METVNLFGAHRGRLTQAAVWAMENDRFSTQELTQAMAVSTPTAIDLLRRLEERGLVQARGEFGSTGGRKPRAWTPCPGARHAIGVDITHQHVSLVAVNLAGRVTCTRRHSLAFSRSSNYFEQLNGLVNSLCDDAGLVRSEVLGVGLSIPGIVSEGQDLVLYSHALRTQGVRIEEFERYLDAPCRMVNDANAGCLAEARNDENLRDAVYLSLSNSVGSAILIDRRLYLGYNMRSGEVGHATLVPDGLTCYCGKNGCVDAYCRASLLSGSAGGNLRAFFEQLRTDGGALTAVWETYLDHVAVVVNNLRMVLDCDVIIGGYVGKYIDDVLPALCRRVAPRNTFETDAGYVKPCTYKKEAAALGAAILWVEDFLQAL